MFPSTMWRLFISAFIMDSGLATLFPVLPLYVRQHGGTAFVTAMFVAAPLAVSTATQVPAGRLCDRIGRRPFLVSAPALFALLAGILFIDRGPLWLLLVARAAQGVAIGAYIPALRATVADLSKPDERGLRFAQLQGAQVMGLLVGPAIGGGIALWRYSGIFAASAVAAAIAAVALTRIPETRIQHASESHTAMPRWWLRRGIIIGSIALGLMGLIISMFDVVWPQYMASRGNDTFVIGLSDSLFAIPPLILANPAGKIADRYNRRILLAVSFAVMGVSIALYPIIRWLPAILGIGEVEACGWVLIMPILLATISDAVPTSLRGRAMGLAGLFETGSSAVGAATLGSLYGIHEAIPFMAAAAVSFLGGIMCALAIPRFGHSQSSDEPVPLVPWMGDMGPPI